MTHYLPVGLQLTGRAVVMIGAGKVATERMEQLLRTGAELKVVAPEVSAAIASAAARGELELEKRPYSPGDCAGAYMVCVACSDRAASLEAFAEAQAEGALVNVCDDPEHCDFIFAARVERGPLTVSILTHGSSPALSARVRRELEAWLGPEYGELASLLARWRQRAGELEHLGVEGRKELWEEVVHGPALELFRAGRGEEAEALVAAAMAARLTPAPS